MRRLVLAVPVLMLAAGCTSAASSAVKTAPVQTLPVVPTTAAATKPAAKTGQAIDLKGAKAGEQIRITLVKVVDPSKPASEFDTIAAGKRQIALQIRIVNTGTSTYNADPMIRVKIEDAAGESFSPDLAPDTTSGPAMDSGLSLAAGGTALGYVTAQIPTGTKVATVQFVSDILGGNVAQWTVG